MEVLPESMMHDTAGVLQPQTWLSDQMENTPHPLRLGTHHAVDRRQLAHTVRRRQDARAVDACIGVGRVRRIQLVRREHILHRRMVVDRVIKREGELANAASV